jgi:MFS transporter, DHA1 family, tetracycline resistance protein
MRKSSLLVLFLIVFVDLLGFGIVIPLLPYYADAYGASPATVGAVVAVYSLMQFFFSPVWGRLSDRIGRRPVLLISLSGSIVGYTIFAFAPSLPLLFLSRIVAGIAAANIGTAHAYIADVTTPENRARGMGLIGAAFGLGFIFGPPIGGILSSASLDRGLHGNLIPGLAAAGLSAVAWTIAAFVLAESRRPSGAGGVLRRFDFSAWRGAFRAPLLATVLVILFLLILGFASMETTVTLFAKERFGFTPRDLGYFFGFMGVIVAVIQGGFIGRLARAFGERKLVAAGALSLMTGFALVPFVPDSRYLYPVAFLVAVGQALSYPNLMSLVTKASPASLHGSVLGVSQSVASLSRVLGPLVGGFTYGLAKAPGSFFTAAVLAAIAALLMFAGMRMSTAE